MGGPGNPPDLCKHLRLRSFLVFNRPDLSLLFGRQQQKSQRSWFSQCSFVTILPPTLAEVSGHAHCDSAARICTANITILISVACVTTLFLSELKHFSETALRLRKQLTAAPI